jgi:D-serine deaminase-like pyridoxal phosphate-dependent protein
MSQPAPAAPGQRLEEVDTPALVLDLDVFEQNQATLFDLVRNRVRVRPHA